MPSAFLAAEAQASLNPGEPARQEWPEWVLDSCGGPCLITVVSAGREYGYLYYPSSDYSELVYQRTVAGEESAGHGPTYLTEPINVQGAQDCDDDNDPTDPWVVGTIIFSRGLPAGGTITGVYIGNGQMQVITYGPDGSIENTEIVDAPPANVNPNSCDDTSPY